jgi:hypothetical protein
MVIGRTRRRTGRADAPTGIPFPNTGTPAATCRPAATPVGNGILGRCRRNTIAGQTDAGRAPVTTS